VVDATSEGDTDATAVPRKIQSFLQGSLRSRPDVDLNTYYVLALNEKRTSQSSIRCLVLARASSDARDAEESG
jgi:hypothetical protein